MLPVRQIARHLLPRRAPALAGRVATPLDRCLLLALLLHIWLIVLIGNAPGGTAKPGEGVYGSISVLLTGPGSAKGAANGSTEPRPDLGPAGGAARQRFGGVVRQEEAPPSDEPGAARLGQWAPQANEVQRLKPEALAQLKPSPALSTPPLAPLPDPVPPMPETAEAPRLAQLPEPTKAAPARTAPMEPAPRPEPSIAALPPLTLPLDSRPASPSVARSTAAPLKPLPEARIAELAAMPALTLPLSERPSAISRPNTATLSAAPSMPPTPDLAPLPQLSLPMSQLASPSTTVTRAAPAAALAPVAAASAARLDSLQPLPRPALPLSALATPSISKATAAAPISPMSAEARQATLEVPALPATVLPLRASSEAVSRNSAGSAPALSKLPEQTTAGAALEPLPPAPTAALSTAAAGNNTASPASGQSPTAKPGLQTPGQRIDLSGRSVASEGAPDAGSQQGHDVATAPSAAASAPKLNLTLPLRGGPLANRRSSGLLDLLAQPPEVKSKLQKSVEEAAREDCRKAYAEKGLLAALPLAADAARDKGCRW
ncbi:hypothetical protein RQP53_16010 [Paucibacter sp. APW11]|uniref:Uncharacterized protein n=1 Tax=Roseateles aquae TaxID=3077235 RepID=A0ABU3PDW4_9BURK|nr:hypothetical protein [Paucibacter sp. APW11]MDT9000782.1 hypothetical protein [Paucibacter sp. APW11]